MRAAPTPWPEHWQWRAQPDSRAQAEQLAERVAQLLEQAVAERGRALLRVSGGRSPVALFERLAEYRLPWQRVLVSLVDERWVPPRHAESNESLVRRHLLKGPAAAACLVGWYRPAASLEQAAEYAEACQHGLPAADVLVLGMGEDGHCASLFPGSPRLAEALAQDCAQTLLPMQAPGAPRQRLSLTLPALLAARQCLLAIQGEGKWQALEQALQTGQALHWPVAALRPAALELHWCPAHSP